MREIALDTETTGLSPSQGHRIIEIGAVELYNKVVTGREFHYYINPRRKVSDEAYKVHGISSDFLLDKPIFANIATEFLEFINGAKLIIHNAAFDLKFLNYELSLVDSAATTIGFSQVIDTLGLARQQFPGRKASLDALCKYFKIDLSVRKFHGALKDAKLLTQVYLGLTVQTQQSAFSLTSEKNQTFKKKTAPNSTYKTKIITPTTDELNQHKKCLEQVNSPVWNTIK